MEKNIQVLDKNTIDQIAAGEVIERPQAVVKELVENAVDAGATAVAVEIKDGGVAFIRITDNGRGIPAAEVPTAFLRHATSKIRSAEDLVGVASLDFRGEALSSIAAVAQVELITRTAEEATGTRYVIEGGEEKTIEETGAPEGTTFLVRNLFYNTPARRKFLKTPKTEAGYISDMIERLALSHPEISFKFINNNQTRLHTSGNGNLKDIIYHVYGREVAANLIEIGAAMEGGGLKVSGFIGNPTVSRGNRNFENYYINHRYVKSSLIAKAIEDGYKSYMMQHKYPFVVLHFEMDGELIDVNVHPTKMELRFSNQEAIYQFVLETIQNALAQRELIPRVTIEEKAKPEAQPQQDNFLDQMAAHGAKKTDRPAPVGADKKVSASHPVKAADSQPAKIPAPEAEPAPAEPDLDYFMKEMKARVASFHEQKQRPEAPSEVREHASYGNAAAAKAAIPDDSEQMTLFDEKLLTEAAREEHKLIGQIFGTYWMVEFNDQLFIIDQHAAHEKVLYERMMKDLEKKEHAAQLVDPPIILSLSMQEEEVLQKYMENFTQIGFEIEHFGGKEYTVRAVPADLYRIAERDLLLEMLDSLNDAAGMKTPELINERLVSMSCKAAVKGNHHFSVTEAQALIDELMTLENPYNCPHGRPTIIAMTKYELEKKFKRIV